ncbi:MAG: hypothetical protein M3014_08070 [Chloroflexota bacterium]|nr:hypothetical protein [Chloroflexota bacterium]
MSTYFVGTGVGEPVQCEVTVEQDGQRYSLNNKVRGIASSFQWDGGGPGSSDLARALLWEATGNEPEFRIYRLFKSEVVAAWPLRAGECWRIGQDEIRSWLAGVESDTAVGENAAQTTMRLEQTAERESRLKSYAQRYR